MNNFNQVEQGKVLKFKSTVTEVDTFLMDTFRNYGTLSPKSNVKVTISEDDVFEGICVGNNIDNGEHYIIVNTELVLIFPNNTLIVES